VEGFIRIKTAESKEGSTYAKTAS